MPWTQSLHPVVLHSRRDFTGVIKDLEMGRLSWIIGVGPEYSEGFYKGRREDESPDNVVCGWNQSAGMPAASRSWKRSRLFPGASRRSLMRTPWFEPVSRKPWFEWGFRLDFWPPELEENNGCRIFYSNLLQQQLEAIKFLYLIFTFKGIHDGWLGIQIASKDRKQNPHFSHQLFPLTLGYHC